MARRRLTLKEQHAKAQAEVERMRESLQRMELRAEYLATLAGQHKELSVLFGERVRQVRLEKSLTLEDVVARGGGGTSGRLSRLERGQVSPTLRTVEEIARALCVDPAVLLMKG